MKDILTHCFHNPAVDAIASCTPGVAAMHPQEEAVVMSACFLREHRSLVIVKPNLYQAQDLYIRMMTLLKERVFLFAVEESLQVEAIASSPELTAQKIETMSALLDAEQPVVCITHVAALIRYLPSPSLFLASRISLKQGQTLSIEHLKQQLVQAGYRHSSRVDQPLTFSFRGGVVDIFSVQYDHPLRIEFFDDEIDSIRLFDATSQRTIEHWNQAVIIPATDLLFTEQEIFALKERTQQKLTKDLSRCQEQDREDLEAAIMMDLEELEQHGTRQPLYRYRCFLDQPSTVLEYMHNPYVILSCKDDVDTHVRTLLEETVSYLQDQFQSAKGLLQFDVFAQWPQVLGLHTVYEIGKFEDLRHPLHSGIRPLYLPDLPMPRQLKSLINMAQGQRVIVFLKEDEIRQVIPHLLELNAHYQMIGDQLPKTAGLYICMEELDEGFSYEAENLIVVTGKELFHVPIIRGRYASKFKDAQVLEDYNELIPGDYVVHQQHGIGRYLGIVTKEFDGIHKDYLHVAYKGDDVLLVPLEQFQLVRKFVGGEGVRPKLNKLGTNEWKKTKEKLQANVEDIAERLLQLYAAREGNIGHAYAPDGPLQKEFEDGFTYELTRDQAQSIQEVKHDMEQNKPMDRLLCGDVGFGKTEVALRAAFKAVVDHKQVAYLCPTTILSRQHYLTFKKRLSGYPVEVALLNRFVDPSEQKRILTGLQKGTIDIVIGTHRLLSKDVKYHDLGFLIIDEEQRFGVESKEKIKEMKQSIDVLSLSATPIPRTLQMSLIGVRSLSQLQTPPNHRMPVQTYVIEKNPAVIKEVIQRELARKGQVFYLYNNTQEIYQVAKRLQQQLPEARIAVAHGKMNKEEIEDVMLRFTDNEYNVLVCTTIIETGIDIPNANTILIDRADTFGLSQLYQIKGRVGRSDRVAYAYLMYTKTKQLSEVASKRLQAIKDFTELGSGYKIAMRDLTIRGAGDLLGAKQAGFINTVGMDMYVEMLHDAILTKKGLPTKEQEIAIKKQDVKVDGYVPQAYAPEDYEKIRLYQRMEQASSEQQLEALEEEVIDRFGSSPKAIQLLFEKKRMDLLSNNEKVEAIKEGKKDIQIRFQRSWCQHVDGVRLFEAISKISIDIKFKYEKGQIILLITKKLDWLKLVNRVLEAIKKF